MQNTGNETILLVDDNEDVAIIAKLQLQRFGYTIVTNFSGAEALETFKSDPDKFDLVISDIGMPGMNGYNVMTEIRKIRKDIPVVLCSGSDESMLMDSKTECTADGFLMKPFTMQEISRLTRCILDQPFR